jgi:hypothetical protein
MFLFLLDAGMSWTRSALLRASHLGVGTFRLPLVRRMRIEAIFAVFALFLFAAFLAFFAFFAAVAHGVLLRYKCKAL